jgi:hypothetical protein
MNRFARSKKMHTHGFRPRAFSEVRQTFFRRQHVFLGLQPQKMQELIIRPEKKREKRKWG